MEAGSGELPAEDSGGSEAEALRGAADAIRKAARRSKEWIVDNLGKDAFEGFKVGLESIVKDNEEKVEGGAL